MTPSARELLRSVDPLPAPARQRVLAETALAAADTAELDVLLDGLVADGPFGERLALSMAICAGHRARVLGWLEADEPAIAATAWAAAVRRRWLDPRTAGTLVERPLALRSLVYRVLRRRPDPELADALLPLVKSTFGAAEAARLLPACGSGTVGSELPGLAHAVTQWSIYGRRHPAAMLDLVDAELAAPEGEWPATLGALAAGIWAAAPALPDRVLELLERVAGRGSIPGSTAPLLAKLARVDSGRLLRIFADERTAGGPPRGRTFWRSFRDADDAVLVAIGRIVAGPFALAGLLRELPPTRRWAVYAGVTNGRDPDTAGFPIAILDLLPRPLRFAEARRCLDTPHISDDQRLRWQMTARLGWAAAELPLRRLTIDPDAERRAVGYQLLLVAAGGERDSSVLAQLLASFTRLTNEQDPVRSAALSALAAIPEQLFDLPVARVVGPLLMDGVRAHDSSDQTRGYIGDLAGMLLRQGVRRGAAEQIDIAVDTVNLLIDRWISPALSGLDRNLPKRAEVLLWKGFQPRIEADARRGRYGVAASLAAGLGRRGWGLPELQAALAAGAVARDDAAVRRSAELWLADPKQRSTRVEALLRADRSLIVLPTVEHIVGTTRTDLLDTVLAKPIRGRFLSRKVRHIPMFDGGSYRWMPRQVNAYAGLLRAAATESDGPGWQRVATVRALGRLPGGAEWVRPFVSDDDPTIAEVAIAALARSDRPAPELPLLLTLAAGDRSPVAVPAVARSARFVAPRSLATILPAALPNTKVTTRKELVRLIAAMHIPGAAAHLAKVWSEPRLHRDVRMVLVVAARELLPDEQMWLLLQSAAADEATAAAVLSTRPGRLDPDARSRYAALVATVAGAADQDVANDGLARLSAWARYYPPAVDLLVDVYVDLSRTATWRSAMVSLVDSCAGQLEFRPLIAALHRLHAAADWQSDLRDLAARQRIVAMVDPLSTVARRHSGAAVGARQVAAELAGLADFRDAAVRLAAAAIRWMDGDPTNRIEPLLRHASTPASAGVAAEIAAADLDTQLGYPNVSSLLGVAAGLADRAEPAAATLALSLIEACGPVVGWTGGWPELLAAMRQHSDPDVRERALGIFIAPE